MAERLMEWADQHGYRIAWGSASVIEDVQREIVDRRSESEIDERFFERELRSIVAGGCESPGQTVVLVAKPCSAHRISFDVDGRSFDAVLPPTYFRYRALFEEVRLDLARNVLKGARVEYLAAPLKATAGRLGLIADGRNNIGYVAGVGSYFQLCGYLTDAGLPKMRASGTDKGLLLEQCENCGICSSMCPTGAITEERVLLRADHCLTYANENPGDWPDWVNSQAHNCLVGCLECQRACPANPELEIEDTGLSFSAAETRLLLSGKQTADDRAESGIRSKLAWLGQPYIESVLGRNLKALIQSRDIGSWGA
jgi:epoxyqueuosine reductase